VQVFHRKRRVALRARRARDQDQNQQGCRRASIHLGLIPQLGQFLALDRSLDGSHRLAKNRRDQVENETTDDARYPELSPSLSRNLKVALSVQNLSDRRPPYLQIPAADLAVGQSAIPFDGANASPVGRLISLQITKGW
jgi:hypothetical protein